MKRRYIFEDGGEAEMPQESNFDGILSMLEQNFAMQEANEEPTQEYAPAEEEDEFITNLREYDEDQEKISSEERMEQMFQGYMAKIDERMSYFQSRDEEENMFPDDPDEMGASYDTRNNSMPYFNSPSSNRGGNPIDRIAAAIGTYESGNNTTIRGKTIPSGMYKGQQALGKYQIMPGNLPSWSMEALGRQVSEQEFLNNPQLQDQIAKHQMTKIYQKYGNEEDVASVWLTGKPRGAGNTARDVNGTDSKQYVANVMKNY